MDLIFDEALSSTPVYLWLTSKACLSQHRKNHQQSKQANMMRRLEEHSLQIEKTINDSPPMERKIQEWGERKLVHEKKQAIRFFFFWWRLRCISFLSTPGSQEHSETPKTRKSFSGSPGKTEKPGPRALHPQTHLWIQDEWAESKMWKHV